MQTLYRWIGISRNKRTVQLEIDRSLQDYDTNGSETLGFDEFLRMMCLSEANKLHLNADEKREVLSLALTLKLTLTLTLTLTLIEGPISCFDSQDCHEQRQRLALGTCQSLLHE